MSGKKNIVNSLATIFLVLLIGSGIYIYVYWDEISHPAEITIAADTDTLLIPEEPPSLYGLPIDSFFIVTQRVKRNEFLSKILEKYRINASTVDKIVRSSEGIFDFRKIRYGNDFTFFLSKDSTHEVMHLVYEQTPIDYILVNLTDSIFVQRKARPIEKRLTKTSGTIESSLWNTIVGQKANPMLALELSEIYAWSIDFFGLQVGDSFNVVYDELYVDTVPVGLGEIKAAYFKHMNEPFFAIPFEQDSVISYFDQDGKSLRKAFLKAPLRYSRISSKFSNSRMHPILKIKRPHHGVDYAAPIGTPVVAIGDGKVIKKAYSGGAGNLVKIKHNSMYTTAYMHLSHYGKGVTVGGYVRQGDIIGYVGSTGLSTGPHLDFRFYKNGQPIDPLKVKAPPVEPIQDKNIQAFDSTRAAVYQLLN